MGLAIGSGLKWCWAVFETDYHCCCDMSISVLKSLALDHKHMPWFGGVQRMDIALLCFLVSQLPFHSKDHLPKGLFTGDILVGG